MTHTILANCLGRDIELHPGLSSEQWIVLSATGIHLFAELGSQKNVQALTAEEESVLIGKDIARRAFIAAVGWALALKEHVPEAFQRHWTASMGGSEAFQRFFAVASPEDIPIPLCMEVGDRYAVVEKSLLLLTHLRQAHLPDQVFEVGLSFLKFILNFTCEIFLASQHGSVEVSFS